MKHLLLIIALTIQSITAIGQSYTLAEYVRIEVAELLTSNFQEAGFNTKVEAIGPGYLMLGFSGEGLYSEKGLEDFIRSTDWKTFESFYDDYGFIFVGFTDWGIFYLKSDLKSTSESLNNPEGKRITKFNYR